MKALAGENVTEGLLSTLATAHAGTHTGYILIFNGANLEKLAECADKLKNHNSGRPRSASDDTEPTRPSTTNMIKQVAAFSTKMEKLTKRFRSRSRNRMRQSNKTRDSSTEETDKYYYHRKFGSQARKCTPSCKFQAKAIQEKRIIGATGDGLEILPRFHVT